MRRETGTYLSPGSRRYRKHWVPQIFTKRIGSPVQSSECSPLAKLPTWAARWVSSGCPQDPGRSLGLSCLPMLDLVLNLFPLPASARLSLFSPWPLCACQLESPSRMHSPISPRNLLCKQLPLQCLKLKLCNVTPDKERRKSWPGVQWPEEEGLLWAIPQPECHVPC